MHMVIVDAPTALPIYSKFMFVYETFRIITFVVTVVLINTSFIN